MSNLRVQVTWQVDDGNCFEGTFLKFDNAIKSLFLIGKGEINYLDADTTTNAEGFRDDSNPVGRSYLNAELAHTDHGARLFAFLTATFRFALIRIDNGYPSELVCFFKGFSPGCSHFLGFLYNNNRKEDSVNK
jgi:hypothetical protein